MSKTVVVTTSMFALYGNHIYVTIEGDDRRFEYRARNPLDAKSYIERILQRHFTGEDYQIISAGDTIIHFVYQHNGD